MEKLRVLLTRASEAQKAHANTSGHEARAYFEVYHTPELQSLRDCVQSVSELALFEDGRLHVGNVTSLLDFDILTQWLVFRATETTPDAVLVALQDIVDRKPFKVTVVCQSRNEGTR